MTDLMCFVLVFLIAIGLCSVTQRGIDFVAMLVRNRRSRRDRLRRMAGPVRPISILFARRDSVYKTLPDCDVWDEERDARNWAGGLPVVAHPPCAQWGRLYKFATVNLAVKSLAVLAVRDVRNHGGVLEHPCGSKLWKHCGLPKPGHFDKWGGFTISVLQQWFGHRAEKATWLYICGLRPADLPEMPFVMGTGYARNYPDSWPHSPPGMLEE